MEKKIHENNNNIYNLSIKFLGYIFSGIIIIFFMVVIGIVIHDCIKKEQLPVFNALEFYPFEESENYEINNYKNLEIKRNRTIPKFMDKIKWIENKTTEYCTERIPFRMNFIMMKKYIDKRMGLNMTTSMGVIDNRKNDVVAFYEDDYLGSPLSERNPIDHINKTIAFGEEMISQKRNFLIFENPSKFCDCLGYDNCYEENREIVNDSLRKAGLLVLDLDEYIMEHDIDYKSLFFKTDHHWLPRSGLWGNEVMCSFMNDNFGTKIDTSIFDLSNYEIKNYESRFLGSLGKKVTTIYAAPEDFELIIPIYDSDITVFSSAFCEYRMGRLENIFYDLKDLNISNIYKRNEYSMYTNRQETALIICHNNQKHDGTSLLLIHLSFADVQIPFLTQCVENFYAIDLRTFEGSLQNFIKKYNPQNIVLAYPTSRFGDTTYSPRSIFDFN